MYKRLNLGGAFRNAQWANSDYTSQFVGSNFEEMKSIADTLDKRARTNIDNTNQVLVSLAQDPLLKNDEAIRSKLYGEIYGQIENIAKSDKGFENSTALVSGLARDYLSNQQRLKAIENFKRAEEFNKLKTVYGPDALNFGDDPTKFSTVTTDEEGNEVLRDFNLGIEKRGDYSRKMQELLGKVAADGFTTLPSGQTLKFGEAERYLIKTNQIHKLSTDKLNALVEGLLPAYKSTAEGAQDVRRLTQLEGIDPNAQLTVEDGNVVRRTNALDEDIRKRFRAIAAPQAFSQTATKWDDFGISVAEAQGKVTTQPSSIFNDTAPSSPQLNQSFNPIQTVSAQDKDIFKAADGQWYRKVAGGVPGGGGLAGGTGNISTKFVKIPAPEALDKELADQYNRIRYLAVSNPKLGFGYSSLEDYKKANEAAIKKHSQVTAPGVFVSTEQAKDYDDQLNRNISTFKMVDPSGGSPLNLTKLAETLGVAPDKIKLQLSKLHEVSPRKDMIGGYAEAKVLVDGESSGKISTVLVPLGDTYTGKNVPIDIVYKNSFYQGKDTFTKETPYIPMVGTNGRGTPITDDQGELIVYTVTRALPLSEQKEGEPAYQTTVIRGKRMRGINGDTYDIWDENNPMDIADWAQWMKGVVNNSFQQPLNAGQTVNQQDIKAGQTNIF